jgi:tripartite-type tricarboxylate transporter receptor subunit TctC
MHLVKKRMFQDARRRFELVRDSHVEPALQHHLFETGSSCPRPDGVALKGAALEPQLQKVYREEILHNYRQPKRRGSAHLGSRKLNIPRQPALPDAVSPLHGCRVSVRPFVGKTPGRTSDQELLLKRVSRFEICRLSADCATCSSTEAPDMLRCSTILAKVLELSKVHRVLNRQGKTGATIFCFDPCICRLNSGRPDCGPDTEALTIPRPQMRQNPFIRRRTLILQPLLPRPDCAPYPHISQNPKALRFVVPYPPGGARLTRLARVLSEKLPASLQGRTVIVDNRPGAGGNIAAGLVAKSDADGSSVLVTSNNHTINLALYQKPGYTLDEFEPIAQIGVTGFAIVAHPSTKFKTLARYAERCASKARFNLLRHWWEWTSRTPCNRDVERSSQSLPCSTCPTRDPVPSLSDVVGGQLPIGVISVVAAQPLLLSGQLVGLGRGRPRTGGRICRRCRPSEECGFPKYEYSAWMGVIGRKGMPEAEIVELERQLLAIAASDDVGAKLHKQGIVQAPKGRADFKTALAQDAVLNRELVKTIGVQVD